SIVLKTRVVEREDRDVYRGLGAPLPAALTLGSQGLHEWDARRTEDGMPPSMRHNTSGEERRFIHEVAIQQEDPAYWVPRRRGRGRDGRNRLRDDSGIVRRDSRLLSEEQGRAARDRHGRRPSVRLERDRPQLEPDGPPRTGWAGRTGRGARTGRAGRGARTGRAGRGARTGRAGRRTRTGGPCGTIRCQWLRGCSRTKRLQH